MVIVRVVGKLPRSPAFSAQVAKEHWDRSRAGLLIYKSVASSYDQNDKNGTVPNRSFVDS